MERIQPINNNLLFKQYVGDSLEYREDKLFIYKSVALKCLRIIGERYKVYVDYGFKGNSRFANDKSDYYVVDTMDNTILCPTDNDFGSIIASLETKLEKETPFEEKIAPFISETRILTMTVQNLIQDGWRFEEKENGDLEVIHEDGIKKVFKEENKFKNWILAEAENY
ncbi:MAG: hypothetical protein K0R54_1837 [Clostridiaceae bacterium]|jgi:hypothetical protein|nr:hypothetical protein [Clostridiaceae bacterium]